MREPSGAYSVVVRGAVPLARRVSPAAARNSGTSSSAILPGAMPCRKTAATLGGGPAGEAVRLLQQRPCGLGGFDEESTAAVAGQGGDAVRQGLPFPGLALVQHAPHVDVDVAEFRVQVLRLALLCGVQLPVGDPAGRIGTPGVVQGGGGQVGSDDVREAVGEEAGLGAVAAAQVDHRQAGIGQMRFEQGQMAGGGQGGFRIPEHASLPTRRLAPETLPRLPVPTGHAHARLPRV
ncbi:hypothetical protein SHIRM173S_13389 [Streptomyces hirsutus]